MHFIFRRNDESSKIRSHLSRRWNFFYYYLHFISRFEILFSCFPLPVLTSSSHSHIIFFCVEFIHCHIKDANNASNFDSNFYNEGTVLLSNTFPSFSHKSIETNTDFSYLNSCFWVVRICHYETNEHTVKKLFYHL